MTDITPEMLQFIQTVGVPAAILFGCLFLAYRALPSLINLFTRGITSLEKIADSMGGLNAKSDELRGDIRDLRDESREHFQTLRDLIGKG